MPDREVARTLDTTTKSLLVSKTIAEPYPSPTSLTATVLAEVSIFTRVGVRRIARFAFQLAQSRPRKLLTYVTK